MEPDNYTVLIFYETLELRLIGNRRNVSLYYAGNQV